jgi:hypothetical protein
MALLVPISKPAKVKGVFNPIIFEFVFASDSLGFFDGISVDGNQTIIVTNSLANIITIGGNVLIGGDTAPGIKGQKKVLQKIVISSAYTRLVLETPNLGELPDAIIVPLNKQQFSIWAGFEGEGSSILSWQQRDLFTVAPNVTTLTFIFEVQAFLKKYFTLTTPVIGNDYNISLRYAVGGIGDILSFKDALTTVYGFEDPTEQEINDRFPLGEYPINFVTKKDRKTIPVLHSILDNEGVGANFQNPNFATSLVPWENGNVGQPFIFDINEGAVSDGRVSGLADTARIGQSKAGKWRAGRYIIELSVINSSTPGTGFNPTSRLRVFASDNSIDDVSSVMITYANNPIGNGILSVSNSLRVIKIEFDLTQSYDYLSFSFLKTDPENGYLVNLAILNINILNVTKSYVRNILTKELPALITQASYSFSALVENSYSLLFQHSASISSLNVTPALPSWITLQSSPANQISLVIKTTIQEDGDYNATDYSEEDYSVLSINNLKGCYHFVFKDGTTIIFTLNFCVYAISETIPVCEGDIVNLAYLNNSGGYNSIALEGRFINGREFGRENTFKTSDRFLKRSNYSDVYDTISITSSVLSKRILDSIKELRSSIHVLLYNEQTQQFDIPVFIEKSDLNTYGNKFNQARTSVSLSIKKSKEVLIQTQ